MIPLETRRSAERRRLEALIAEKPSPARFRTFSLAVLFAVPAKAREMKLAGFNADFSGNAMIALPVGTKPPEPDKEPIDIADYSGATVSYQISTVEPLFGQDCYTLGLKARNTKPRSTIPGANF